MPTQAEFDFLLGVWLSDRSRWFIRRLPGSFFRFLNHGIHILADVSLKRPELSIGCWSIAVTKYTKFFLRSQTRTTPATYCTITFPPPE